MIVFIRILLKCNHQLELETLQQITSLCRTKWLDRIIKLDLFAKLINYIHVKLDTVAEKTDVHLELQQIKSESSLLQGAPPGRHVRNL
nr:9836_t:CDS:2 [Entrophospora candida]